MLRTTVGCTVALVLTACGPAVAENDARAEPQCDPWTTVCEVTMRPNWSTRAVLDLERAQVRVEPAEQPAGTLDNGSVRASVGRYLVLQSDLDERLVCLLPERFERLDDVPTDPSVCDCQTPARCWDHTALFGLAGSGAGDEEFSDAGLLLKTAGGDLYRARVLVADPASEHSTLTIEYEGVM